MTLSMVRSMAPESEGKIGIPDQVTAIRSSTSLRAVSLLNWRVAPTIHLSYDFLFRLTRGNRNHIFWQFLFQPGISQGGCNS